MGQTWWVVDLRSTNGLHVAGNRMSEIRLTPGTPVLLSPLVTLNLIEETAPQSYPQPYAPPSQAPQSYPQPYAQPSQAPSYPQPYAPPSQAPGYPQSYAPQSYPQPYAPQSYPQPYAPAAAYPAAPMRQPVTPLSALGPRSLYSDDEAPFYPQMRPMGPARGGQPVYAPPAAAMAPAQATPYFQGTAVGPGELSSSALDPQRQAAHIFEQRRTAGVAPSPLLHVCQTCGQRTMPDAVYCQNCHHSVASECARCRLSLLPIQDLCPRCQTPNPASVRRVRRTAGPS